MPHEAGYVTRAFAAVERTLFSQDAMKNRQILCNK
jgi:hypothetical protein